MNIALRTEQGAVIEVSDNAVALALADLPIPELLAVLRTAASHGNLEVVRDLVDAVEIEAGQSVFDDEMNHEIIEQVVRMHNLRTWLETTAQEPSRSALYSFWDMFMVQARTAGIKIGHISEATGGGLWKATPQLAMKMIKRPKDYGYLPASRINHPVLVEQTLDRLKDPERWLEVLVGDAIEQMFKSEYFLKAFCLREDHCGLAGALYGVGVCLLKP